MAHGNCESMRSRAFTKGRSAFDSDDEYRRALNGEFDGIRKDPSYEADEGPDDGEDGGKDAGDLEDLADEEAVKAELEDLEERIGGTKFLVILERFMKDCSGREEPPYLPFPPIQDKEVTAIFRDGSGSGLRLRYGAYGLEADRLERTVGAEAWLEVVKTWKGLSAVEVLDDRDDALYELAEEAEIEKEDLEDRLKDEFFDDLPGVLADRKRGAAFIDFVTSASPAFADEKDGTAPGETETCLPFSERFWLAWDGAECEFRLKSRPGETRVLTTWEREEFLEKLREVAWDGAGARESILGGGDVEDAWKALDNAWYDEEDDGSVEEAVDKFLDLVQSSLEKGSARARMDVEVVGGTGYGNAGRMDMTLEWSGLCPGMARLTVYEWSTTGDKDENSFLVPLAFLRWWEFCRDRGW